MLCYVIYFFISAFLVEYITEVVRKKWIFAGVRNRLMSIPNRLGEFFYELLACGFCTAFWVALLVTFSSCWLGYLPRVVDNLFVNFTICQVLIAGLSNNWHLFKDRYLETYKDIRYS